MRVLITSIGSSTAMAVAYALIRDPWAWAERGPWDVLGTDYRDPKYLAASDVLDIRQVPPVTDLTYIPQMIDVCERHKIDVIIPIYDAEIEVVAKHAHRFQSVGTKVLAQPWRVVAVCNDKLEFGRWAAELGHGPVTLRAGSHWKRWPIVVKPRFGTSSRGLRLVHSQAELNSILDGSIDDGIELIGQHYLEGPEYTCDVIADWNGEIIDVIVKHKIEARAGLSYLAVTEPGDAVDRHATAIARELGAKGPLNVQSILTDEGLQCFEVNPRFSSSLPLTVQAGINSPAWYVKTLMGQTPPVPDWREGVVMRRYWEASFWEDK